MKFIAPYDNPYYPHGSLMAYQEALSRGAKSVEVPLQINGEGQVMVWHKRHITGPTTNLRYKVNKLSTKQLSEIDTGYHFFGSDGESHPYRSLNIHMITLESLLHQLEDTILYLHIPHHHTSTLLVEQVVRIIREKKVADRICIVAAHSKELNYIRFLIPEVPTSLSMREIFKLSHDNIFPAIGSHKNPKGQFLYFTAKCSTRHTFFINKNFFKYLRKRDIAVFIDQETLEENRDVRLYINGLITHKYLEV